MGLYTSTSILRHHCILRHHKPGYTNYRDSPQVTNNIEVYISKMVQVEVIIQSLVNERLDPNIQQKRKQGTKAAALEDVSCAGLDGTLGLKKKKKSGAKRNRMKITNNTIKHHKASPISEFKFAYTRKPVERVMHGTADAKHDRDVIGWLPEQL
ncbi:hypothetical protein MTR_8g023290 [Medicago truncatula]|nr:hypothetical protein MTR_8g023290 [Medicago truncatula]